MPELGTYGSVGGAGGNPRSDPAALFRDEPYLGGNGIVKPFGPDTPNTRAR